MIKLRDFNGRTFIRLLSFLKGRWPLYIVTLLVLSCSSLATNYMFAMGMKGLIGAIAAKDTVMLLKVVKTVALSLLILLIILPGMAYIFDVIVGKTTMDIRNKLFWHIQRLPMSFFENMHSGDIISRINNDIQTAEGAYSNHLNMIVMVIISGVGSIIIIFRLQWKLSLVIISVGILQFVGNTLFVKPLKNLGDIIQKSLSNVTQRLSDTVAGASVIRMFNMRSIMHDKFVSDSCEVRKWSIKRVITNSILSGVNTFGWIMGFIGTVIIGSIMVINGETDYGTLMAAVQMSNGVMWMFDSIGNFITQIQASLAGADRFFEILDTPLEKLNSDSDSKTYKRSAGQDFGIKGNNFKDSDVIIDFDNVYFSYNDSNPILNGIDLSIRYRQVAAFAGHSGSGKSTLFKLLMGYYLPTKGTLKVMGKPLEDYTAHELRSLFAYVPQDSYLYTGSIAENIGLGRPGANMEDIQKAAQAAYAHDFIMEFPEGYNTQVGDRGVKLSGGQKQRIAIARALLKDAPILLLDEATSSLDSESEKQVQKALEVLMEGRTTIMIAHRLSTIQHADIIYVIEEGNVAESGDHRQLIENKGIYYELYNMNIL